MELSFFSKLEAEITSKFPLMENIHNIKTDGSINRLDSTKQGDSAIWVCVHEWEYKGNFYQKAIFGNWREGQQYTVTSYDKRESQSKEFYQQEKKKQIETQAKLDKEKQEKFKECREKWTPFYFALPPKSDTHEYLKNKKINSNFHARIDHKGVLFIPAWNSDGLFVGGQRIFMDPTTNKFEKRYTFGIEKMGSFCPFGDIRSAEFIYICEGFATAASVYMALKGRDNVAVACVWDTSNILPGAQAVRRVNPNSNLVFAADRDINSDPRFHNIGEKKAIQASNKLSNSIVRVVKFEMQNDKWSDFNDLHQFEGLDQVAKQLHVESTDFLEIIPLGFDKSKYYYFSTRKKQIIEFTGSDHAQNKFLLEGEPKYWGDKYGYVVKQDGTLTNNPDWKKVIWNLGKLSAEAGPFDNDKVRSVGAWEENKKIIVNIGDKIYYDNEFFPLYNNGIKSNYFYQATKSYSIDFNRPLGNSDMIKFVEAFQMLKYKNHSDYIILLGWIFSAQIFAALPWRPHIWITGPRGAGKSTILNYIHDAIMFSIIIQNSTAAGIRQKIENNAIAVILDESEPNTDRDREKLAEVLTLARQSSTRSSYQSLRGSASGNAISYNTNTCFCMGSIQLSQMGGADTSRFFVIEMKDIKDQSHEDFVRLQNAMAEIQNLSQGLFVRAVNMYDVHIKNIETAKKVIKERRIESRQADQLAPIIAGYWAYFSTELMDVSFVTDTIAEMNFENSEYAKDNDENDSEKCLQDIMELQIPGRSISVGQIIEKYAQNSHVLLKEEFEQMLGLIGLRYFEKEKELFIVSSSSSLKKQMERFSTYSDYKNILKRHERFKCSKTARVAGKQTRGLLIGLEF